MTETEATVPSYLAGYEEIYAQDPHAAAMQWFKDARYGLFLHYGLYSLLGRHEWVQFREKIRVAEYESLQQSFTAHRFSAQAIADLAVEAGMKYINITTRHHDSFCLWHTRMTSFHSYRAPCGRDLVAELAAACQMRGLGLCLYYSHGRDWRHPHAPNNGTYPQGARPDYDPPEPTYATGDAHDLNLYLEFMTRQVKELLTYYGPIASIWFDGIATPQSGDPDAFRVQELYDLIRELQPQCLISYKSGYMGTEDYFAPEWGWEEKPDYKDRQTEVCACMSGGWGYTAGTEHLGADDVWLRLSDARSRGWNLLLNTGPRPNGEIDPQDAETLRQVGERIRKEGFPGG